MARSYQIRALINASPFITCYKPSMFMRIIIAVMACQVVFSCASGKRSMVAARKAVDEWGLTKGRWRW